MGTYAPSLAVIVSGIPDGSYARPPWVAPPEAAYPPQAYIGPFASNQERMLTQAIATNTMPGVQLQEFVRPNIPQIQLIPARYGYVKEQLGIADIIELASRSYERTDFSGEATTTESTSRNTLGKSV